ncbi:hypothetical protein [Pseudoalteromonas ardens]|uniref:hypothetical protein n=1 Tax=Pseudoalteromonas ardens TaxID=3048490 RepID=UPI0024C231BE|nr:hypothetical protein [Pseudoalteromonas sp. R96]MDK1312343.1 hypothetical protein [Pseudoalteromonas sp. R96]
MRIRDNNSSKVRFTAQSDKTNGLTARDPAGLLLRLDCYFGWIVTSAGLLLRLDCYFGWIVTSVGLLLQLDW